MAFEKMTDGGSWNRGILERGGGFLQSWEWGAFQQSLGREVVRLRETREGGMMQAVRMPLPLGKSYWYVPRGPLGTSPKGAFSDGIFVRFEPDSYPEKGMKVSSVQPAQTMILELTKDENELLAGMHEKTRYNIRLARKKGVRTMPASAADDGFTIFWELVQETSERAGIRSHDEDYYRKMLNVLTGRMGDTSDKAVAKLLFTEHDGKVLAGILLIRFGDTVTYVHGASSRDRREVMAPHLLHWNAIREAKSWGVKTYDFWGVAPMAARDGKLKMKEPSHPWAGITRFKKGFGGAYLEYPGTFDLPKSAFWYKLYRATRRLRP